MSKATDETQSRQISAYEALNNLLASRSLGLMDSSENDSIPGLARNYMVSTWSAEPLCLARAPNLETIYLAIEQQAGWAPSGLSGTYVGAPFAFTPTANPLSESAYMEYLEATKRDLESRVATLEVDLAEIRVFWPTIKKLIDEYRSAGQRVGRLRHEFAARPTAKGALEIAKMRDALDTPLDENFLEEVE